MLSIFDPTKSANSDLSTPVFDRLEKLFAQLKARGQSDANVAALLKRIVNSPLVALLVAATPTPIDDAILALLRS